MEKIFSKIGEVIAIIFAIILTIGLYFICAAIPVIIVLIVLKAMGVI